MSTTTPLQAFLTCAFAAGTLATAQAESQPSPPLAHFTFNGHAQSASPVEVEWDLRRAEFRDDALYLNGIYEFGPDAANGYHAICRTPALKFTAFTATLRFKAESFANDPARMCLLVGGRQLRWFTLERSQAGNLRVTFNNGAFEHDLMNTTLEAGKWTVVSCGVDLDARKVIAYLDGKPAGEFSLPTDFRWEVVGSKFEAPDKLWTFVNYSNTNLFHGLVDELIIHNRMLSSEEFASEFRQIPRPRSDADVARSKVDSSAEFLTAGERELLDLTNRTRARFGLPFLKASRQLTKAARGHAANMARQQILNHTLDGKTFDQRIDATGYKSSSAGENIWSAPTASQAIASWMGSPGHQRNMLSAEFKEIGVGVGESRSKQKYWTQVFAKPDRPAPKPHTAKAPR